MRPVQLRRGLPTRRPKRSQLPLRGPREKVARAPHSRSVCWVCMDVEFQDVGLKIMVSNPSAISALGVKSPHIQLLRVNRLLRSNPTSSNTTSLNSRVRGRPAADPGAGGTSSTAMRRCTTLRYSVPYDMGASLGKRQMGSALMGSLQFSCVLTDWGKRYALELLGI